MTLYRSTDSKGVPPTWPGVECMRFIPLKNTYIKSDKTRAKVTDDSNCMYTSRPKKGQSSQSLRISTIQSKRTWPFRNTFCLSIANKSSILSYFATSKRFGLRTQSKLYKPWPTAQTRAQFGKRENTVFQIGPLQYIYYLRVFVSKNLSFMQTNLLLQ